MLFSYESAMRELKRLNDNGGEGMYLLKKRWYGWIIVDNPMYATMQRQDTQSNEQE